MYTFFAPFSNVLLSDGKISRQAVLCSLERRGKPRVRTRQMSFVRSGVLTPFKAFVKILESGNV